MSWRRLEPYEELMKQHLPFDSRWHILIIVTLIGRQRDEGRLLFVGAGLVLRTDHLDLRRTSH